MINKFKIYLLAQIVNVIEEAAEKLDIAFKENNIEEFERSKKIILEFERRLSDELRGGK